MWTKKMSNICFFGEIYMQIQYLKKQTFVVLKPRKMCGFPWFLDLSI